MTKPIIADFLRDFVSLVFPDYCLGCEDSLVKGEKLVCTRCLSQLPQTNYHLFQDNPLKRRLSNRIHVSHAMALFRFSKNGRVQRLLHTLKYQHQPELGIMLGGLYGARLVEAGYNKAFDIIIPVPLHASRRRKRGYNQSAKFAQGLAESLAIPFSDDLIERKVRTETQTRKTKLHRWQNMADVFTVKNHNLIENRSVLLVDDVITTGATLEACGDCLLRAHCSSLSIACIAEA